MFGGLHDSAAAAVAASHLHQPHRMKEEVALHHNSTVELMRASTAAWLSSTMPLDPGRSVEDLFLRVRIFKKLLHSGFCLIPSEISVIEF
jgi:hypothetical protein